MVGNRILTCKITRQFRGVRPVGLNSWRGATLHTKKTAKRKSITPLRLTFNPWEITNHGDEGVWTYVTLARNVNENVDALVKNFCGAYYGTGGEYIYSLLTSEQARYKKVSDLSTSANNGEDAVGIHVIREGVAVKSYWDEKEFDTWYGYIKSAVTAIENSGATEEAKTEYKKRIMREGIAVRYMKYYVFNSFVTLASGETDSISGNDIGRRIGKYNQVCRRAGVRVERKS